MSCVWRTSSVVCLQGEGDGNGELSVSSSVKVKSLDLFQVTTKDQKAHNQSILGKIGMIDESFRRDVVNSVVIEKELVPMKMFSNFPSFDESYKICKP
jgi:hypothetical protein